MKKFTAILLVFSLMMLSANLYAKERRGAELIVTKKDGLLVEGELITIKKDSLLLLDTEGKDVSIDIADIEEIVIVKKSKAGLGALIGLVIGGVGGAVIMAGMYGSSDGEEGGVGIGLLVAAAVSGIGAFMGASAGADKTIKVAGRTDDPYERHKVLEELRKKARVRDYK